MFRGRGVSTADRLGTIIDLLPVTLDRTSKSSGTTFRRYYTETPREGHANDVGYLDCCDRIFRTLFQDSESSFSPSGFSFSKTVQSWDAHVTFHSNLQRPASLLHPHLLPLHQIFHICTFHPFIKYFAPPPYTQSFGCLHYFFVILIYIITLKIILSFCYIPIL